jgi:hypothetical protein
MEPQENNKKTVVLQDEGLRKLKGFVQIPRFILLHHNLSLGAKVTYGILLGYAWQDDFCFPAQHAIAGELQCSVRQAQRFLEELRDMKLIAWKQRGLNQPNIYYILSLPPSKDVINQVHNSGDGGGKTNKNKDTTPVSYPDTTYMSHQDTTLVSYYKYSYTNKQNNVNVSKEGRGETGVEEPKTDLHSLPDLDLPREHINSIANEILAVFGDQNSKPFYTLVASKIPESFIRQKLSELKQGNSRSPARVFVSIVKNYAAEKIAKQRLQGIALAKEGLFRIGSPQLRT